MIDMLGLTSDQEVLLEAKEKIKKEFGLNSIRVLDKNYNFAEIYSFEGSVKFWVKSKPRLSSLKKSTILINPSRFSGHSEISYISKELLGKNVGVNRVDLCSDLPISLNEFQARVRVKHKRKRSEFEEGNVLTGFYFGTRNEVIAIYDKARQLEKFNKFKLTRVKKSNAGVLTRVEVRLRGGKIPYKSLDSIIGYRNFNPFKNIQIVDFKDLDDMRSLNRCRAEQFKKMCKELGFNYAFSFHNQSNNIHKKLNRYISTSDLNSFLIDDHWKSVEEYLRS